MKSYAVITDIHGNLPALEKVLEDIKAREIEHIFCLGDMVAIGHYGNEVIELLLEQNNISFVMGNHELAVIAAYNDLEMPNGHVNEREHHKWLADRIQEKYIKFMRSLPMKLIFEDAGLKHYFAHYHLNKSNYFMPIESSPTVEKLDELYADSGFDVVCFGHHHFTHQFRTEKKLYFNPGSLGCSHKPIARYGIIRINDSTLKSELVEVPYDNSAFLRSFEELKVPEREFILKVFYGKQI